MAEHFLSLVEHLVFSIFMPILDQAKLLLRWKQTNKQKKKQLQNNTVERFVFFDIHANFGPSQLLLRWKQTNKQTKRQLPNDTVERCVFFDLHPNFGIPKKASTFCFFFDFRPKSVWWTLLLLFASPFYCNQRFCTQRLFLLKAFLLLLKKERFTCADKTFFYLVLGTRGLDKQIKNIFFRWSKRYLESEKKRAKNTSSASHHVA